MIPIVVGAIVLAGLVALYFLFLRRSRTPREGGRPDRLERPELSGPEQQKRRQQP
jgi:hypothetical protein